MLDYICLKLWVKVRTTKWRTIGAISKLDQEQFKTLTNNKLANQNAFIFTRNS